MYHPQYFYNRTEGARLIKTQLAQDALTGEWLDSPAAFLNPDADCCDVARETRGYQHTKACTFTPAAPAADAGTPPVHDAPAVLDAPALYEAPAHYEAPDAFDAPSTAPAKRKK